MKAVEASGLTKVFRVRAAGGWRRVVALDRVSFEVGAGELFSIMGPNGAGKTTLVKILSGYITPDSGTARVMGFDVCREAGRVKSVSHVLLGGAWLTLFYGISARRNLLKFGRIYGLPRSVVEERIREASKLLDIGRLLDRSVDHLSTGEKQKVALAIAFMIRTPVLFLDEPTRSLDPVAAGTVRRFIREALNRDLGITVLLLTQYPEEAELLSDRIGIMNHGRMLCVGSVEEMRRILPYEHGVMEVRASFLSKAVIEMVRGLDGVKDLSVDIESKPVGMGRLRIHAEDQSAIVEQLIKILGREGCIVDSIRTVKPSLEDVFISLVRG